MITIKNEALAVVVSTAGAEVQSLKDVKTEREYLWQGDAKYWDGRSPLLFPICGGLWNGTCRINGRELKLPKHGFVRLRTWRPVWVEESAACLEYVSTVGDYEIFPFAYRVTVTYRLEARRLSAALHVTNLGGETLWFQMGGHPAIALPDWREENAIDGYLKLEGRPTHVLRAGEQGCLEPEVFAVPADEAGLVPLCVKTFENEALIFENGEVTASVVLDRERRPVARIASDAPGWLFWSPQGVHTPFVCSEPWYGLPDRQGFTGDVAARPHIQRAEAGETWAGGYSVEVF